MALAAVLGLVAPVAAGITPHDITFFWASGDGHNEDSAKQGREKRPHPNLRQPEKWISDRADADGAVNHQIWVDREDLRGNSHVMRIRLLNASKRQSVRFKIEGGGGRVLVQTNIPPVRDGRYSNPGTLEVYDPSIACEGQRQGGEVSADMGYVCLRIDARRLVTSAGMRPLNLLVKGYSLGTEQEVVSQWRVAPAETPFSVSSW
jgi:hypothetical protein